MDRNIVDASPTKEFFINMIVKDISLTDAIAELIDNSVDGALRQRGDGSLKDLYVKVSFSKNTFIIEDNCGGMDIVTAKTRAFRFGTGPLIDETADRPKQGIGRFNVGMKRSLFKMGKEFVVQSTTDTSKFILPVNIPDWAREDDWSFIFSEVETERSLKDGEVPGTLITVTELYEGVASQFVLDSFKSELIHRISLQHQYHLNKELRIEINGYPLRATSLDLIDTDEIKSTVVKKTYRINESEVFVKIVAGVAESDNKKAGWYIYCNGRMILEADQTKVTGWNEGVKFHNQFSRFRGFVFFKSDNVDILPWNTTKTGVDYNSPLYSVTREQMLIVMRPVIDFLNEVAAEKKRLPDGEASPLEHTLSKATYLPVTEFRASQDFKAPESTIVALQLDNPSRISYSKPKEIIELVRKKFGGGITNKQIGEKTFDYFVEMECDI